MYSLIGSWSLRVIMRLAHLWEHSRMCCDSNTGGLGAKRACAQFKNGSRVFQLRVCFSHVLCLLIATRSLILNVSTCSTVCRRHDDPMNGPTGDLGMVRLP